MNFSHSKMSEVLLYGTTSKSFLCDKQLFTYITKLNYSRSPKQQLEGKDQLQRVFVLLPI